MSQLCSFFRSYRNLGLVGLCAVCCGGMRAGAVRLVLRLSALCAFPSRRVLAAERSSRSWPFLPSVCSAPVAQLVCVVRCSCLPRPLFLAFRGTFLTFLAVHSVPPSFPKLRSAPAAQLVRGVRGPGRRPRAVRHHVAGGNCASHSSAWVWFFRGRRLLGLPLLRRSLCALRASLADCPAPGAFAASAYVA